MTRKPLAREIALVLVFKLVALTALYLLFFGPAHRFKPSPAQMVEHLATTSAVVIPR